MEPVQLRRLNECPGCDLERGGILLDQGHLVGVLAGEPDALLVLVCKLGTSTDTDGLGSDVPPLLHLGFVQIHEPVGHDCVVAEIKRTVEPALDVMFEVLGREDHLLETADDLHRRT